MTTTAIDPADAEAALAELNQQPGQLALPDELLPKPAPAVSPVVQKMLDELGAERDKLAGELAALLQAREDINIDIKARRDELKSNLHAINALTPRTRTRRKK